MNSFSIKRTHLNQCISLALLASTTQSLNAADIEVNDQCSLIEAIQAANQDAVVGNCTSGDGHDVITVVEPDSALEINEAFGPSQNPVAFVGLPSITSHVTIEGNGLTIMKSDEDAMFRMMEVYGPSETSSLHLMNTTITGANRTVGGAALRVYRAGLHIENCQFIKNNSALSITDSNNAIIENSVFRDNKTIRFNRPSAIGILRSHVTILNTSIINNHLAPGFIFQDPTLNGRAALDIRSSNVNVINSTISGNYNQDLGAITIGISANTFTPSQTSPMLGNQPETGDGYHVVISNSTITGNTANLVGGISSSDVNLTLSGNIISGNVARLNPQTNNLSTRSQTTILSNHNLLGEYGNTGAQGFTLDASDRVNQKASSELFYPLVESNGQFVHPLKANTAAIDAFSDGCIELTTDQEGSPRVMDGDGDGKAACDLGAHEKSQDIVVDENCRLADAIMATNTDTAVGTCQAGLGADVIQLPRDSQHELTDVASTLAGNDFGLPIISSGVVLAGNDSVISRVDNAPDFGILGISSEGDLALMDTTISHGSSTFAGVFSDQGNFSLVNSNVTQMNGLAVLNRNGAQMMIDNSTISHNTIPETLITEGYGNGAINTGSVKVRGSAFHHNTGGAGAALYLSNNGYNSLVNSTISSNTSTGNSPFVIKGSAIISGLTVTNNQANLNSGGAYIISQSYDANFSDNEAVIILQSIFSGNTLNESVVEDGFAKGGSTAEIFKLDNGGRDIRSYNNIFGQNNNAGIGNVVIDGFSTVPTAGVDTVIGPLQNNGGSTLSHAPVPNSVAIDNTGVDFCILVKDQANHIRPFDGDGDSDASCDIGAVEAGSFNPNDLIFKDGFDE